jgi:hypothetical protein
MKISHQFRYNEINGYNATIAAFFTEADILFSKKLAAKVGLRASYNDLLEESAISPRISMAYKVSKTVSFLWLMEFYSKSRRRLYQIF